MFGSSGFSKIGASCASLAILFAMAAMPGALQAEPSIAAPPENTNPAIRQNDAGTVPVSAARYDFSQYDATRLSDVQRQIGSDDDVRENLISARDALAIAESGHIPDTLSASQRKLVDLVTRARDIPLGRDLITQAAAQDIWLCIDNNVWGGGYYADNLGLLTLELKDNGSNHNDPAHDDSADEAWARARSGVQHGLYHELGHFYQFRIRNTGKPPPGIRSADAKLWDLGIEAQAELIAGVAMRQQAANRLGAPVAFPDDETLRAEFVGLMRRDDFHKRYYEVDKGRLDDGSILPVAQYLDAMGTVPGMTGNFLAGKAASIDDIYVSEFSLPDPQFPLLNGIAAATAHPVDTLSLAELRARGAVTGRKMLETPDQQYVILAVETPLGVNVEQYRRLPDEDGQPVFESADIIELEYGSLTAKFIGAEIPAGGHGDIHLAVEAGKLHMTLYRTDPATGKSVYVAGDPEDSRENAPAPGPRRLPAQKPPAWMDSGTAPLPRLCCLAPLS